MSSGCVSGVRRRRRCPLLFPDVFWLSLEPLNREEDEDGETTTDSCLQSILFAFCIRVLLLRSSPPFAPCCGSGAITGCPVFPACDQETRCESVVQTSFGDPFVVLPRDCNSRYLFRPLIALSASFQDSLSSLRHDMLVEEQKFRNSDREEDKNSQVYKHSSRAGEEQDHMSSGRETGGDQQSESRGMSVSGTTVEFRSSLSGSVFATSRNRGTDLWVREGEEPENNNKKGNKKEIRDRVSVCQLC